jgi:hypothetical protein
MHRGEVSSLITSQKEDDSNQALDSDAPKSARQRRVIEVEMKNMKRITTAFAAACLLCSCSSLYYGYLPGSDYKILKPEKNIDLQGRSFNIEFRDSRGNRNVIDCSEYMLDRETELEGSPGAQYFRDSLTAMIQGSNGKIDPASPDKIVVELEGLSFKLIGRGYITVHGFVQFKVTSSFLNKTYCSDMTDLDEDAPLKWNSWATRKTASRLMVSGSMRRASENFVQELAGGKAPMMNRSTIRTGFRTDGLDQDFLKKFKMNSNYFYKFDPRYSVDYMVSIVRMNVFSSPTTENMGEILLSLGLVGKEQSFDCNAFYSKLSAEEKNVQMVIEEALTQ